MPPFWNMIAPILKLEITSVLPLQMNAVVLRLIALWEATFNEAANRNYDAYIDYEEDWGKAPLSYYPNHPKKKILRKYVVNNIRDGEL